MVYDIAKLTPFVMLILPTPKLIASISKARTISTTYNTYGVNSNGEIVDNLNVNALEMHAGSIADKEDVIQSSAVAIPTTTTATTTTVISTVNSEMMCVFDVGLECVVTNWLSGEAVSNPIWLMIQDNDIKKFSEFTDIDENIVKSLRYRRDTNSIFQLLRYINYMDNNGDYGLTEDPTQWGKKDFIDLKCTGEPEFANSITPYRKTEDDIIQSWRIATIIVQKKDKKLYRPNKSFRVIRPKTIFQ